MSFCCTAPGALLTTLKWLGPPGFGILNRDLVVGLSAPPAGCERFGDKPPASSSIQPALLACKINFSR
jgi:hypothetical protein